MALPRPAETAALLGAFLLCAAFLASFVFGLRDTATPPALPSADPAAAVPEPVRAVGRVEVLNASGRGGIARIATDHLRSGGFDVVYYGNAAGFDGDSSFVLDRTGNNSVARAAARRLGIMTVRTQRDTTLFVDATIVLGRDWNAARADERR